MAKPKLALIPSAQGSKFYSVLPSSGVGDFDFTRSGSATRINSQGLIETVGNGVSRLNYPMIDGKVVGCPHHILEPQRTNLIQYSEDFSQSYWTKSRASVTNNSLISPNGTLNASKFTQTTSTAWGGVVLTITPSGASTLSIFAKKIDNDYIALIGHNSNDTKVYFNLDNGTIGTVGVDVTNADIQNYGNGWYRCILTASSINRFTVLHSTTDNGNTSNLNAETSLWGAQVEQGSYPTSYIPTNGSAVTRSAETANGSGDADTFNDSEGVLMAETSLLDNSLQYNRISISDGGSNSKRIAIGSTSSTNQIQAFIVDSTVQVNILSLINNIEANNKIAFKYKTSDFALWVNGFELATETAGTIPTGLDVLNFDEADGTSDYFGNTKQLQYYDSVLTDSELETLTSWVSFSDMANGQLYTIE